MRRLPPSRPVLGLVLCGTLAAPAALAAQEDTAGVPAATATAIHPESVKVGEPFLVGVTVRVPAEARVAFPPTLEGSDTVEQRGPLRVARDDHRPGLWRAYYPLVAWSPGTRSLPKVTADLRLDGRQRRVVLQPPPVTVVSVLPDSSRGLTLKGARGYAGGLPWEWLLAALLLLAVAVAAWAWWRRRSAAAGREPLPAPPAPAEQALASIRRLERAWRSGRLTDAEYFDGLEGALREYVEHVSVWPRGRSIRELGREPEAALREALSLSAQARFGRRGVDERGGADAADRMVAWIRSSAQDGAGSERDDAGPEREGTGSEVGNAHPERDAVRGTGREAPSVGAAADSGSEEGS